MIRAKHEAGSWMLVVLLACVHVDRVEFTTKPS